MNKFTVRPNKSIADIIDINAKMRIHSIKMQFFEIDEERKLNGCPSFSTLINPAGLE